MGSRLYLLLVDFLSGIGGPARPAPSLPHCLPLRRPLSRPGFPLMMDKNEGERGCPYSFLPLLVRPIKGRKKRLFPSSFSSQEALERTPGHTLGDEATTRLEMISRRNHKKSCVCGWNCGRKPFFTPLLASFHTTSQNARKRAESYDRRLCISLQRRKEKIWRGKMGGILFSSVLFLHRDSFLFLRPLDRDWKKERARERCC